ncbi:hypothetical protein VKT23_001295 [Stygiomarasmius scandens]|uniref:Glucose-methanol-choline oxidoreductase N-terminal domain-containing protein n=1 Tax=Marasmiellus scandens TaxID=2682957 RepID=A0ABR1K7T2_9AGAR
MVYTRGSSDDYDRWARITGDDGWSWNELQTYIRKNERFVEPADHHNTTGQFNPAVHGFGGMTLVSLAGFPSPIDSRVIGTAREQGTEFPFSLDYNSGNQLGVGWAQSTIGYGMRSSSSAAYLGPEFSKRNNLHVLLNTRVTRVLPMTSTEPLTIRNVELTQDVGKTLHVFTARKEVILSAGTIMSPTILLNSGIGDAHMLSSHGIKVVHHLPSVGQNLTNQPILRSQFLVNSTRTLDTVSRNATLQNELLQRWNETKTGPFVDPQNLFLVWLRLPDNSTIFERFSDPAAGPNTAHIELLFSNGALSHSPPATGGSVSLNSSNPLDYPLIDFNLLQSDYDLFTLREAYRAAVRFISTPSWAGYILGLPTNATTDEELNAYIGTNAGHENHPVGTASMSPKGASWGVVDPDLKVKGVDGLRVVDASVFPRIPSAHTQAPTYIVAERASDLIKKDWNLGS